MITIVEVDRANRTTRRVSVAKVRKSDAEWRRTLSPNEFHILRQKGTELPFSGIYSDWHADGVFRCAGCGNALFRSSTKFNSGTGWPSFWEPIARENVGEKSDRSFGMVRTEVLCSRCNGHLGHVFDDGPPPTGLRYCINSAALEFESYDGKAAPGRR